MPRPLHACRSSIRRRRRSCFAGRCGRAVSGYSAAGVFRPIGHGRGQRCRGHYTPAGARSGGGDAPVSQGVVVEPLADTLPRAYFARSVTVVASDAEATTRLPELDPAAETLVFGS